MLPLAVALLVLAGCEKDPISRYQVPHEEVSAPEASSGKVRVLAALVPHGDDARDIEKEFRELKGDNVCYC